MTISLSDNNPRISYSVSAGVTQTSFTVPFEFFDLDDLNVYVDGVQKTKTTHYTLASGGSGSTGSITLSVTGVAGGSTVVITRDIDLERTTDFQTSGPFNIASLNTELDRFTAIAAELQDGIDRSLRLTDFDAAANLTLPDVNTRKGKTLAFNASTGAVEAGPSTSDVQTVSATAADIATLADIEDGTNATNAIQTVAGISGNVSTVAGISGNVTTVAGISANVTTVASDTTDIGTVASNISSVNTNATNISAIQGASANASTATTKASEAAASQVAAASSASSASTSASTATTKAAEASTSASNASTSETNSAASATAAASSATAAAASQTAAAASAASAASAYDSFDDRYLGVKASDPTVDNDGDPLSVGLLYFSSSENIMKVYDGASWIAATSAGNVSLILYEYTATSGQTTFSGADDNAATLSYTVNNIQVVMNGIVLDPSDFTATTGTSVVLATGAAAGSLINIYAFKSFTVADTVSASSGGTFAANVNFNANANFGDNDKAIFGAGNDLQIYHDGTHSYVQDAGTGDLRISGNNVNIMNGAATENYIVCTNNGSVAVKHDNATKLETSSTGVDVTGTSKSDLVVVDSTGGATPTYSHTNNGEGLTLRYNDDSGARAADIVAIGNNPAGATTAMRFFVNPNSTDAASEVMRLKNGKVGIGEASPAAPLHISTGASTTTELRLTSNNTGSGSGDRGRIAVYSSRNDGTAYEAGRIEIDRSSGTEDKAHILFATNNGSGVAEKARITAGGNVGIGTSSPVSQLTLAKTNDLVFTQNGYGISWGSDNGSPRIYGVSGGSLSFKHGGGSIAMTIDASGRVTTPNQPRFRARNSGITDYTSSGAISFNTEDFDVGNNYSGSTFTCPVAGLYFFSFNVFANTGHSASVDMLHNGVTIGRAERVDATGGYETIGFSLIFECSANDAVRLNLNSGQVHTNGVLNFFTGYLIC